MTNPSGKNDARGGAGPRGRRLAALALALLLGLAVAACSSSEPEAPAGQQPAAEGEGAPAEGQGAAAEGEAGAAMEGKAPKGEGAAMEGGKAMEGSAAMEEAKEGGMAKEGMAGMEKESMGGAPPAPPFQRPPPDSRVPYEKAFPEDFNRNQPIRVGLLASPVNPAMGERIAVIIGKFHRQRIESSLGQRVQISFVSRSSSRNGPKTVIHYRPDYLKAALKVAAVMPGQEVVERMSGEELERTVDIIVYLGDRMK